MMFVPAGSSYFTNDSCMFILSRVAMTIDRFGLVTGFIGHLQLVFRINPRTITISHTLQFTAERT
jgi:hypothetical protein